MTSGTSAARPHGKASPLLRKSGPLRRRRMRSLSTHSGSAFGETSSSSDEERAARSRTPAAEMTPVNGAACPNATHIIPSCSSLDDQPRSASPKLLYFGRLKPFTYHEACLRVALGVPAAGTAASHRPHRRALTGCRCRGPALPPQPPALPHPLHRASVSSAALTSLATCSF